MSEAFNPTGFHSFWFEMILRDYVFVINEKVDIDLNKKLPFRNKYKNMWNGVYHTYAQSIHYLTFEKTILPNRKEYLRCFCYYYCKNPNKWKAQNIVEDNFKFYYQMEDKFKNIENTFDDDMNYIIKKAKRKNLKLSTFFSTNSGFPEIFKMYFRNEITLFSIVIFQELFDILDKIDFKNISIADESKLNNIRILFQKIHKFVYNDKIDWKKHFKTYLNNI